MTYFQQIVTQLTELIHCASLDTVRVELPLNLSTSLFTLDWFDRQNVYPKFYWQPRSGNEEVMALGALSSFTSGQSSEINQVLGANQRVWGGRSFDGRTSKNPQCLPEYFFLPKIEVIRRRHTWYIAANINHHRSAVIETLQQLVPVDGAPQETALAIMTESHSPSHRQWSQLVGQVLNGIEKQCFKKVVLARETRLLLSHHLRAARLLKESRRHNKDSFHFMLALSPHEAFVGSTPERLYQRQSHRVFTEALAGTIERGATLKSDQQNANWLMSDNKNVHENQYVVDDIVGRLQGMCTFLEVEPHVSLVKLRQVQHLRRKITATLGQQVDGGELLTALQPTAAVSGLPRQAAYEFILKHEPFVRGWYAGSLGYVSRENSEFCVAIRSALVMDNEVRLFAGAGIVPGSDAEQEWQELDRKMATLKSLVTDMQQEEACL
ncbi:isochorismate synthase [Vibrio palustris]|uniref:Isochorismate synthase MenF n=1 Tax=Vibrio palustris TaxID=1918946 RepID=A0A1R4B3E3_9VIBR|nr:isochorismate synthase [Vibrio palustris]SJL83438.1 Menaquinone-specific isochorismate synthase [Vibrio palustris]